jgi:hypothetical protein
VQDGFADKVTKLPTATSRLFWQVMEGHRDGKELNHVIRMAAALRVAMLGLLFQVSLLILWRLEAGRVCS